MMKQIYEDIISEGTTGVADECGENKKGENLAVVAQIEIENQLKLFPEMLEMLKEILDIYIETDDCDLSELLYRKINDIIAKAEGGK